MKHLLSSAVTAMLLGLQFGCNSDDRAQAISGRWNVECSRSTQTPAGPSYLRMDDDKTFSGSNLPISLLGEESQSAATFDGKGTWLLQTVGSQPAVYLTFMHMTRASGRLPHGAVLFISSNPFGTHLFYYVGDPDSGDIVNFGREARGRCQIQLRR